MEKNMQAVARVRYNKSISKSVNLLKWKRIKLDLDLAKKDSCIISWQNLMKPSIVLRPRRRPAGLSYFCIGATDNRYFTNCILGNRPCRYNFRKFICYVIVLYPKISKTYMGAFNNYVDKMRGGGIKNVFFVHALGIRTVHSGRGVKKWQNSFHIVVECPLSWNLMWNSILDFMHLRFHEICLKHAWKSFLKIKCKSRKDFNSLWNTIIIDF